nr:hypothetical protein [Bacteriovoracaceae bacterium]
MDNSPIKECQGTPMQIHIHQTHLQIADFDSIFNKLKMTFETEGLHLYPELFLCGYPLKDLCLNPHFINQYNAFLEQLNKWSLSQPASNQKCALMGGLSYEFNSHGLPQKIYNVIFELKPQQKLTVVYEKKLLPNYDIFDEGKYFTAGKKDGLWSWNNHNFALMICEDMWPSNVHAEDPCQSLSLLQKESPFHAVINLSASPFHLGKMHKRLE